MDSKLNRFEGAGEHIWLSYRTQFTTGGRTHTVEMSIPMPVGASAEVRERLLREAEEGLGQLVSHVEQRVPQILQRVQSGQIGQSQGVSSSGSAQGVRVTPTVSAPRPMNKPASTPAPQTAPQGPVQSAQPPTPGVQPSAMPVAQVREKTPEMARASSDEGAGRETAARQNIGASMPSMPGPNSDGNAPLTLPEFIQYIRENLKLTPAQAMNLLGVKSLSGINLREALERLQYLVAQEGGTVGAESKVREMRPSAGSSAPTAAPSRGRTAQHASEVEEKGRDVVGEQRKQPIYIFDEEEDQEGDQEVEEDDDLDELDLEHELTIQERTRARELMSRLRDTRGATVANPKRLQALYNVTDSQVTEEQLLELVEGVWGVTVLNKLKVDQLEALIYWAKEDDFVSEVEAVLVVLEEER